MTQFVLYVDPVLFWQFRQWHSPCRADSARFRFQKSSIAYNHGRIFFDFYLDSLTGTTSLAGVCHAELESRGSD